MEDERMALLVAATPEDHYKVAVAPFNFSLWVGWFPEDPWEAWETSCHTFNLVVVRGLFVLVGDWMAIKVVEEI